MNIKRLFLKRHMLIHRNGIKADGRRIRVYKKEANNLLMVTRKDIIEIRELIFNKTAEDIINQQKNK